MSPHQRLKAAAPIKTTTALGNRPVLCAKPLKAATALALSPAMAQQLLNVNACCGMRGIFLACRNAAHSVACVAMYRIRSPNRHVLNTPSGGSQAYEDRLLKAVACQELGRTAVQAEETPRNPSGLQSLERFERETWKRSSRLASLAAPEQ